MASDYEPDELVEIEPAPKMSKRALDNEATAEMELWQAQRLAYEACRDFVEGEEWDWPEKEEG